MVDFADSTKIAEIADLKQRHQQELATLNILMEGYLRNITHLSSSIRFLVLFLLETIRDRVDHVREKYENELNTLRHKFESLKQENYDLKSKFADEK